MDVFVNNTLVSIFEGAKVKDALEKYFAQKGSFLDTEKGQICDEHKHPVSLNGELTPGDKFKIIHWRS